MNEFAMSQVECIDEVQNLDPLGTLRRIPAIVNYQEQNVHKSAFQLTRQPLQPKI